MCFEVVYRYWNFENYIETSKTCKFVNIFSAGYI